MSWEYLPGALEDELQSGDLHPVVRLKVLRMGICTVRPAQSFKFQSAHCAIRQQVLWEPCLPAYLPSWSRFPLLLDVSYITVVGGNDQSGKS